MKVRLPLVLGALLLPTALVAQQGPVVGGLIGQVDSRQLHQWNDDSGTRSDVVVGAFVDVPTPASWLHVMADARLARRGGEYIDDAGNAQSARIDFVGFSIMPTLWVDLGAAAVYVSLGISIETEMGTKSTAELAPLFTDAARQIAGPAAAAGITFPIFDRFSASLEVRELVQLSPAFRPEQGEIRHRSREFVLKLGMRRGS